MKTILLITIGLYLISLVCVLRMVRQYSKLEKDEDPVPCDNMPGHYEDYEVSERPFFECY